MPPIIITGSAGFIGFHLAKKLLEYGFEVVGIDNLNDYYDKNLKLSRNKYLENISEEKNVKYTLQKASLEDNFRLKKYLQNLNQNCLQPSCSGWSKIFY